MTDTTQLSAPSERRRQSARTAAAKPTRRRGRSFTHGVNIVLGVAGVVGFLTLWEVVVSVGLVPERYLPPPSVVAGALADSVGSAATWVAVGQTMTTWAIGLLISIIAAVVVGILLGMNRTAYRYAHSTIEVLRPIPSAALIPLAVLMFGVDSSSTIFLIVYAAFWQMLVQVVSGVADLDPVALNTARSFGFPWWARMRHIVLPSMTPYAMTGIRLSASSALVLAITGELIIGSDGLGREIFLAQSGGAVPEMYARILLVGFLGVLINVALRAVEKRALFWHASVRGEATS